MIPLTALILTYNERENIARTLAALSSIEQVLLVDSFSTDDTLEIARLATRRASGAAGVRYVCCSAISDWPAPNRMGAVA